MADQFSPDPSEANREAMHQEIHDYFGYLRGLGTAGSRVFT
jgi:hypothetical protein